MVTVTDSNVTASASAIARAPSAPLPKAYEAAKAALAACTRIDECADWANKSQALASYARQAKDDTLQKHATRIQARAIRRCGQLLKQVDGRPQNARINPVEQSDGGGTLISRRDAAADAGLSKRQQTTAVRIANVPSQSFEAQVESDNPPTVTKLAEQGKKSRSIDQLRTRDPKSISAATWAQGELRDFSTFCRGCDWKTVLAGSLEAEVADMGQQVDQVVHSLNSLRKLL